MNFKDITFYEQNQHAHLNDTSLLPRTQLHCMTKNSVQRLLLKNQYLKPYPNLHYLILPIYVNTVPLTNLIIIYLVKECIHSSVMPQKNSWHYATVYIQNVSQYNLRFKVIKKTHHFQFFSQLTVNPGFMVTF